VGSLDGPTITNEETIIMFVNRHTIAKGLTISVLATGALFAQDYDLTWHTVGGGGFELSVTIGD
jgi:hypothetical protein